MAIDGSDNIYVTGRQGTSYGTIKYNSAGEEQWAALYVGPGLFDIARAIAVDAAGNVYVTGGSAHQGPDPFASDYATVKYNNAGQEEWVARYDGPGYQDIAQAIAVDNLGNVFVTGFSDAANGGADYATIKYNSAGQEQWVARYNGPANEGDHANGIALDGSGNVYVTGGATTIIGSNTSHDYTTIKYNSAGHQRWIAGYSGPGSGGSEANAIVVDPSGNVYVTGYSSASVFNFDYATIKYVQGRTP